MLTCSVGKNNNNNNNDKNKQFDDRDYVFPNEYLQIGERYQSSVFTVSTSRYLAINWFNDVVVVVIVFEILVLENYEFFRVGSLFGLVKSASRSER